MSGCTSRFRRARMLKSGCNARRSRMNALPSRAPTRVADSAAFAAEMPALAPAVK